MAATRFALAIDKGSKFELTVQVNSGGVPLALTGWANATLTITEIDPSGPTTLATVLGTISAAAGQVLVDIPSATTAAYTWSAASYTLVATDAAGQVRRLLQGSITVNS